VTECVFSPLKRQSCHNSWLPGWVLKLRLFEYKTEFPFRPWRSEINVSNTANQGRGAVSGACLYPSWDWSNASAVGNKSEICFETYTVCECSICPTCQWNSCFCYTLPSLEAGAHMTRRVVIFCLLYTPAIKVSGEPICVYACVCVCVCVYIQGVPGGMDKTSGECSLC
jgi:hypothetical protein